MRPSIHIQLVLVLFQIVAVTTGTFSQPNVLDSLKHAASDNQAPDSLRAQAMGDLARNFAGMGMEDSAMITVRDLVHFCAGHDLSERMILAKGMLGTLHSMSGAYDSARYYMEPLRDHYHSLKQSISEAETEYGIGMTYHLQGLFPQAIAHCMRGIQLAEAVPDTATLAHGYVNLSAIYMDTQQPNEALVPLEKAIALMRATGNPRIRNALGQLGMIRHVKGDHELALQFMEEALGMCLKLGDHQTASRLLNDIGNVQREMGLYPEALASFAQAATLTHSSYTLIQNKIAVGITYTMMGDPAKAIPLLKEAAEMAKADDDLADEAAAYKELSLAYTDLGDNGKAFEVFKQYILLNDSITNKENTREMTRVEMNYTFEKTQLADSLRHDGEMAVQVKEIQKQKVIRNGFVGGFALVALFAIVFFTQRNRISKEKARSEELLLNILPAEVAEELKAKGAADAVQIDLVTVLFTDFKGFTALSETLSPRELVHDLNECFSGFDRITGKFGIEKIKTIGDAYMAAGGLPTPNITHATDVIQAALEMRDFVAEGKARKIAAGLPFFEVRIGIHTGPVVAGIVGVKKFQYDIWGDTVNTASRMESSGEVGHVNISEATHDHVKSDQHFTFTPRGKVQAKGKGEMEMFFVDRNLNA